MQVGLGLRVEDVCLPKGEVKRVRTERVLVQEVAQVRGRRGRVRERQKHERPLDSSGSCGLLGRPLQVGPTSDH